jgi:hypothetical protein
MTFEKGRKGDDEFAALCGKKWPNIQKQSRREYMEYRKRLGRVTATAVVDDLPPLRRTTSTAYVRLITSCQDSLQMIITWQCPSKTTKKTQD